MNATAPPQYRQQGNHHLLYDTQRLGEAGVELFQPATWAANGRLHGGAPGRGTTVFVDDGQGEMALRHFRRGGLIGKVVQDHYLWTGLEHSRPWREFRLLHTLFEMGLSVPRPLGAHCERRGLWYRADLLTERLPGEPLAACLAQQPLPLPQWQAIGACLRRFHRAGVYHADLNARNILLGPQGEVVVLDFDQGALRPTPGAWQQHNLARLRRSLDKFARLQADFAFDETAWQALLDGYHNGE